MSSIQEQANSIKTIMEQYSKMIQSFDSRLNVLENSVKNCEFLIREQQLTHSQLIKRIESLENNNNNNNNNKQSLELATIEETQYEENHNNNNKNNDNDNDYELEEMQLTLSNSTLPLNNNINHNNTNLTIDNTSNTNNKSSMPILEPETMVEKENMEPTLLNDTLNRNPTVLECFGLDDTNSNRNEHNNNNNNNNNTVDLEVLFSAFDATITLANQSMRNEDFETALAHLKDSLYDLNKYINCDINIAAIPEDKKHVVSVAYCNQAICYGKLQQYDNALICVNKCILISSNWYKAYSTMGALYAYQNINDKAINAYKKAMQLCDDNNVHIDQKNKLQKRLKMIMDKKNNNYNRKRKNSSDVLLNESPAKRVKYNENISMEKRMKQIRDKLLNKTVSELKTMCDMNYQKKSGGKNELVERVCDGVINGAISKCPKCPSRFLEYNKNNGYYSCNGIFDVSTKKRIPCDYYSNKVNRKPWVTMRK